MGISLLIVHYPIQHCYRQFCKISLQGLLSYPGDCYYYPEECYDRKKYVFLINVNKSFILFIIPHQN